ncbi:MAG: acyl-CoA dehydrogenase [Actinobacteria bacterium]|nr:acyl-CoA dehydrogenase [Actinomycetota bacterium]NIS32022.1 acyl-CoA dehydrogenase [Actinomycetota bacterium]NIT97938.1 acyl-CoA dehydrogenase [Actinomycetota bacterium]NIU21582.1 acyl-CoA dehydrogenase [Actinomycetota bacterium]NIU69841.1 acyl-CoA dehydrogenase [Actinomycetota bacterium]
MTDTATDTAPDAADDPELLRVTEAIDALLAEHDPAAESYEEFRGHQFDAGLAWVMYPEGHGGLGVRPQLQRDVHRRLTEAGAPSMDPAQFFIVLAGPTILTHGTEEQKRRFLRPMFTGEEKWCQLFSEPGAGSDFAGLATKAVRDGDEWVVNGQKVWNTLAHVADWGMLVTRTDPDKPKHKGMTYFALDMHAEGVEVRPLRQITGEAEFNEVYMTDVRVPDANRIGDRGDGWRVSLTTLMNERTAIGGGGGGGPKRGSGPIGAVVAGWKKLPEWDRSPARLDEVMKLWIRAEVLRLTNMRAAQNAKKGQPGPEGSVGKLMSAELNKDVYSHAVGLEGIAGQIGFDYTFRRPGTVDLSGTGSVLGYAFLRARANSIEGGTSEVMRNILGEQVLGLPGEPRVDKEIPWIDVPRS